MATPGEEPGGGHASTHRRLRVAAAGRVGPKGPVHKGGGPVMNLSQDFGLVNKVKNESNDGSLR